jgi:cyclohexa-1,5-dienecarbonyl-CoA hydratase
MDEEPEDPHDATSFSSPRESTARFVQCEISAGVARLTLNRPPANVLSVDLMGEIVGHLDALEYRREVKLVVLAATGKYFSAGFELSDHIGDRGYLMLEGFRSVFERLHKIEQPTLSVVAGPALGAGCILAAACDMVLAGASAKLGHPEIKGGVFNTVAMVLLPRLVGRKRAAEMIFGGASLSAVEAERIGLISRAVPDDKLEAEAAALVQRFQEGSAPVLQAARRAFVGSFDLPFPDALRHSEDVYLNQLMATEDADEGLKAIMARRKPVWKDR